jgi:thioredoxin 1
MASFKELLQTEKAVLVDFYADWCGPCKAMEPVIKEVAKTLEAEVKVVKINIDKNVKAAQDYGVQAVPTFIFFKNGKMEWRHAGMIDRNSLLNKLRSTSVNA